MAASPVAVTNTKKGRFREVMREKFNKTVKSITQASPMEADDTVYRAILEVYSWVSICFYVWTVTKIVYSAFLYHYFDSAFAALVLLAAAFLGIAALAVRLRKNVWNILNLTLLYFCICDPFVTDYSTVHRSFPISPPPLVCVPVSVYYTFRLLGPNFGCRPRQRLYGTLHSPSLTCYFLFAVATNSFGIRFFMWTFSLLTVAVIDLQMKFYHFYSSAVRRHWVVFEKFITVALLLAVNHIFVFLFSVTKPN